MRLLFILPLLSFIFANPILAKDIHLKVYFPTANHHLSLQAKEKIDSLFLSIPPASIVKMKVTATTDPRGTSELNQNLAENRLKSVLDFIECRKYQVDSVSTKKINYKSPKKYNNLFRFAEIKIEYHSLFETIVLDNSYTFKVPNYGSTKVTTPSGTVVRMQSGAFIDPKTGIAPRYVDLTLTEYYDPLSMLAGGLETTHQNGLLESGGSIKIEASTPTGKELVLKENATLDLTIPNNSSFDTKNGMMLFTGVQDSLRANNEIVWELPFAGIDTQFFQTSVFPIPFEETIQILENEYDSRFKIVTRLLGKNEYKQALGLVLIHYLRNMDEEMVAKISRFVDVDDIVLKDVQEPTYSSNNSSQNYLYRAGTQRVISFEQSSFEASDLENLKGLYIGRISQNNLIVAPNPKDISFEVSYYRAPITQTGYINCDRFVREETTFLSVSNNSTFQPQLFMVFNDMMAVMKRNHVDGFRNIPLDREVNVLALARKDNQLYFTVIPYCIQEDGNLALESDDFKPLEDIKELNKYLL